MKNAGPSSTASKQKVTVFEQKLKKETWVYDGSASRGQFLTATSTKDNVPTTVAGRVRMWELDCAVSAEWMIEDDEESNNGAWTD